MVDFFSILLDIFVRQRSQFTKHQSGDLLLAHPAITPPSTGRMLPVVQRASSDAK